MIREDVRRGVSDAYYESRNAGRTMEHAADAAADAVMVILERYCVLPVRRCDGWGGDAHSPHVWDWDEDGVLRWCHGEAE